MATGAFAGLVDGFTRGYGLSRQWGREDEDRKTREEERAYLREQRERLRREQSADDDIDQRLSSVPTTTEKWGEGYDWASQNGAPMRDDDGNVMPGAVSTPRAYRDVAADQAAAVRGIGGRRGVAMANQLQQFVNSQDDRSEEVTDRGLRRQLGALQLTAAQAAQSRAELMDGWRRAGLNFSRGDLKGALSELAGGYEKYPDGRKLIVTQEGQFGVATPDGKWVDPPVPVTRENVEGALNYAQRFLDPAAWAQFQTVRQGDQKIVDERGYRDGMLKYYNDRTDLDYLQFGLSRDEFNARKAGGMFRRPADPPPQRPERVGVTDGSDAILMQRPDGTLFYSPVPQPERVSKLFPKVTGDKAPRPTKFLKGEDGTQTALDDGGRPLYNILNGGLEAPVGVDNSSWGRLQKDASKAGVRAALGKGKDGAPVMAFIGRDGLPYSTLEEAAAAKSVKK